MTKTRTGAGIEIPAVGGGSNGGGGETARGGGGGQQATSTENSFSIAGMDPSAPSHPETAPQQLQVPATRNQDSPNDQQGEQLRQPRPNPTAATPQRQIPPLMSVNLFEL